MKILNPLEREAAERRREEIIQELAGLPVERSAAETARAAELEQEQAALEQKLHGIGPPRAT